MQKAKYLFVIIFLCLSFSLKLYSQINDSVLVYGLKTTVLKYHDTTGIFEYSSNSDFDIGRKDGSHPRSDDTYDVARSEYSFTLNGIPAGSSIEKVTLNWNASGSGTFKLTDTGGDQLGLVGLWNDIGNSSVKESGMSFTNGQKVSSVLKSMVSSHLSSGVLYLGALSEVEDTDDIYTELTLSLRIVFNDNIVNFTVENNFEAGNFKLRMGDGSLDYYSSGTHFQVDGNEEVEIEAISQNYNGYFRVWNDIDAPNNKSKWTRKKGSDIEPIASTQNITFNASSEDDNSTYTAHLPKVCNFNFANEFDAYESGGQVKVNGTWYDTPTSSFNVVEKNDINVEAESGVINGIYFLFEKWSDDNTNRTRTITASEHENLTAQFFPGYPSNDYRNLQITSGLNQPITLDWDEHPNSNVTAYIVWRSKKVLGVQYPPEKLDSIPRGTTTYTDNEFVKTSRQDILLKYDIRAHYEPLSTYAIPTWISVYGFDFHKADSTQSPGVITDYAIANYPNPFNPNTVITYQLPEAGHVTLKIYNSIGKEVSELVNEFKQAGAYTMEYRAGSLASGIYYYRIIVNDYSETRKMILLK